MTDLATLLTALAALVTAIGGATAAIILALRSGGRQRVAAAEEAARLTSTVSERGPRGDHDGSARHRAGRASGRPDALVERLERALELARSTEDAIEAFTDDDPDGGGPQDGQ